jgi:speckle-type POZ protein
MLPDSVDLTEAARSVQLFKIGGFTATKQKPGYTASRVCAVGGHDWRIEFHPTMPRCHFAGNDWIMFRLRLIGKGARAVAASFSCRLMDPTSPGSSLDPEDIASSVFHENHTVDAFLVKWSDFQLGSRRGYLKDDSILVQCAINVLPCRPNDPALAVPAAADAAPSVPSSDLHRQFGELLRSQKGADITFFVAGKPVAAHRSLLAARSPVFMAELFGDTREKASWCIEIKDMEVEVFRAMLRFVYTDTVPELDLLKGEQATAMAQRLLEAADRYGLNRLKRVCVEKVCTTIDVDTVATTLALAEQHGCSKLKARCIKFALDNICEVSSTEGFKHLEASCPSVLTELLKLMVEGHK